MWSYAVFTSYQTGAREQIQILHPLLQPVVRHPSIHPVPFPLTRFIWPFLSLPFLSSIRAFQLPFRPQKYDIWCSNDLQTISGNAHHESWKCIFPFPLWRRLHAHREIYTVIAFSFSASFSFSHLYPLSVPWWPFIFLFNSFIFPMFLYFMFASKS